MLPSSSQVLGQSLQQCRLTSVYTRSRSVQHAPAASLHAHLLRGLIYARLMVLKTSWSTWYNMAQPRCACVLLMLLLASSVLALPTEPTTRRNDVTTNQTAQSEGESKNETEKRHPTTVTYILGQPIANGTVQSPAELLSPDRYEFYTFDDDGQIIKKLMSVEEIQRILASSKEGVSSQNHHSGDYYQVLSVTPDIESLPAVRINPNEPLFSIHDVIASVQNVLKAEIKHKMTPPPSTLVVDGFQNAHLIPEGEDPPQLPPLNNIQPSEKLTADVEQKTAIIVDDLPNFNDSKHKETPSISSTIPHAKPALVPQTSEKFEQSIETATAAASKLSTITTENLPAKLDSTTIKEVTATPSSKKPASIGKVPSVPIVSNEGEAGKNKQPVTEITTTIPVSNTKQPTSKLPENATKQAIKAESTTKPDKKAESTTKHAIKAESTTSIVTTASTATTPQTATSQHSIVGELKLEEKPVPAVSTEFPTTMVQVLRVTSSVSQHTSPNSQIPTVTTQKAVTTTTATRPTSHSTPQEQKENFVSSTEKQTPIVSDIQINSLEEIKPTNEENGQQETTPEVLGLSLLDAHPGFTSNNSFLNSESLFAIESLLFDKIGEESNATTANITTAESALSEVQLPMNQDLAESVSSVLSQIANEISLNSAVNFDENISTTIAPGTTLLSTEITDEPTAITEETVTTDMPLGWLKNAEDLTLVKESEIISTTSSEDIFSEGTTISNPTTGLNPQNPPRPFSKPSEENEHIQNENFTVDVTTTIVPVEFRTEKDETLELAEEYSTTLSSSTESTTLLEFVTKIDAEKTLPSRLEVIGTSGNLTGSIEIIQEAETGRIPRPTQQPDEVTSRPGSLVTVGTTESSTKISTTANVLAAASTTQSVTTSAPFSSTTSATITTTSIQTPLLEATSAAAPEFNVSEESLLAPNAEEEVENISISFIPMVIRSSTAATIEPLTSSNTETELEDFKSPASDDILESKVAPDYDTEKNSQLDTSHKVIIAALSDKKTSPLVVAIPKEPTGSKTTGELKQNYAKPQNYVKPQKPVFIKPTKAKPQNLESKPIKPIRPSSSEEEQRPYDAPLLSSPSALELDQAPAENLGLEATTVHLENDVREFVDLCNELAFTLWSSITHNGLSFVRSVVVSPFAVTSLLAMVFLGARGPTSGQMNDILKLDDVVTFNPHLVFRNVTESLVIARNPGISTAAFVRELYSDRSKGKLLDFYKERAQQFYDGHVEEVNFKAVGETLRRQTNHLVKRQTWGKVKDFLQGSTLMLRPPLAAFSANIFQADCSRASTKDRDGEMYFVVLPSNRLRRLVPVPAVVWRDEFLAGYEPNLDATVAAVGGPGSIVTTIFVMPGQQGLIAPGDSLARLEHHLLGASFQRGHWGRLMRSLLRRPGLELQVPRLSHKSVVNVTASLQKMGLRDLFNAEKADLTGLNGLANDLHLSDMVQVNMFSTCGDEGAQHSEFYPATPLQRREKSADNVFAESIESLFAVSDFEDPTISALPLELRPRQARIPNARLESRTPDPPRLRLDRPFLFFVRHNPSGLILHVGRFNPRLMH